MARRAARFSERLEQASPHALLRPPDEAIVERLARTIVARRIDPSAAALQHMNDPGDHPAIIDTLLPARLVRQQRPKAAHLRVVKPEQFRSHRRSPSEDRESAFD
jgi:hypothetical protein